MVWLIIKIKRNEIKTQTLSDNNGTQAAIFSIKKVFPTPWIPNIIKKIIQQKYYNNSVTTKIIKNYKIKI